MHRVVVNHASGIVRMFTKRGERSKRRQDQDGNWHEDVEHRWHHIAKDERFVDFYLQDGTSKVFIMAIVEAAGYTVQENLEEHRFSIFLLLVLQK